MTNKPGYFSILTADVRYDKTLCPSAKLFYSEIKDLTQKEGYCGASNKYFAELYEVDISTIKRWLSSLKRAGHLEIQTEKSGLIWDRRIYINNVHEGSKRKPSKTRKETLRRLENVPREANALRGQPPSNTRNKEKESSKELELVNVT